MAHKTELDAALSRVCWGYRDVFKQTITRLHDEGYLGAERPEVTRRFYDCLSCSDSSLFDHVLKEFLEAFGRPIAWMLDLPAIFSQVVTTGCELADRKLHYGIRFFRLVGEGGLGSSPESVRRFLGWLDRLLEIDEELAAALLTGYGFLARRLSGPQLDRYLNLGLEAHARNPAAGIRYLEACVAGVETIIASLTTEARLSEERMGLERLLHALSGRRLPIDALSSLDSDELILRGSTVVAFASGLYLPDRVTVAETAEENQSWFRLQTIVAAACYRSRSFPVIHGTVGCDSLEELEPDRLLLNLLTIVESLRVIRRMRGEWPGASRLLDAAIARESAESRPGPQKARLLGYLGGETPPQPIEDAVSRATCFKESQSVVREIAGALPRNLAEELGSGPIEALAFLPDFRFSGAISVTSGNQRVIDPDSADAPPGDESTEPGEEPDPGDGSATWVAVDGEGDEEESSDSAGIAYAYDEWCDRDNDYFRDFCLVREVVVEPRGEVPIPPIDSDELNRVRRVFEMIRPDTVHVEKRLETGDEIDHERLVEYLIDRTVDPSPKIRFYHKPFINRRDLSVLILLDSSGSTAETVGPGGAATVLELEKRAALMLGEGLAALGDRFALCGFSGSGRRDCRFYRYKGFDDPWGAECAARLQAARAHQATRIGAALRHAGFLFGRETARTRLLLLITDGKPMDTEYDPESGYAQRDVRMACEENFREGIHTYCISTFENSRTDMETMFPHRRFVILDDLHQLPTLLPRLYLRLTS